MKTSKFLEEHYIRLKGIVPNIEFMATDSELFEALISQVVNTNDLKDELDSADNQMADLELEIEELKEQIGTLEVQLDEERDLRNQLAVESESAIKVWQDALTDCRLEVNRLEEELSIWKR